MYNLCTDERTANRKKRLCVLTQRPGLISRRINNTICTTKQIYTVFDAHDMWLDEWWVDGRLNEASSTAANRIESDRPTQPFVVGIYHLGI